MRPPAIWMLLACTAACNATPIPQPPPDNLDPGEIVFPETSPTSNTVQFSGGPGAAPPNSIIRVTNLETTDPPSAIEVRSDGSFTATISADVDDELRFQVRLGAERKTPIDLVYVGGGFELGPRIECFRVSLEVDLGTAAIDDTSNAQLALINDCSSDATLDAIAFRTADTTFAVASIPPTTVSAGATESLDLAFTPSVSGESEEILLITVDIDGEGARYPVTLHGVAD